MNKKRNVKVISLLTVAAMLVMMMAGMVTFNTGNPAKAAGTLMASEPFTGSAGALHGTSGGTGWGGNWDTQNNDVTVPGYNIATSSALSYSTLAKSGNYAIGGNAYLSAGRWLDTSASGAFASYLTGGLIGLSGKTLYFSVLMRKDANNQDENSLTLHASGTDWAPSPGLVSMGYFGANSETSGTKYWTLKIGSTYYKSNVSITIGTTALLVMKIVFGSTNTVSLFVNPSSLGGTEPGSANASGTTTSSIAFKGMAYYAGNGTNQSSIDELRFGDTFSAVTPTTATNTPTPVPTATNTPTPTTAPTPTSAPSTIGYTADGASSDGVAGNYYNALRYQAASNMTVTQMKIKISVASTGKLKCAIYSDSSGNPGTFLKGTEEKSNLGVGWQTLALTSSQALTSGSYYWLVSWRETSGYSIASDPATGVNWYAPLTYAASWPTNLPAKQGASDWRHSFYALGGATPTPTTGPTATPTPASTNTPTPTPVGPTPTPVPSNGMGFVVGVGAPLDYEICMTFADAIKVCRNITSNNGIYDANGWPTGDGKIGVWYDVPWQGGTYALKYDGRATVTSSLLSGVVISAETYDSGTDTSTRTVTIPNQGSANCSFELNFASTTRGIRNVKLMRPISYGSTTPHGYNELWYRQMKTLHQNFDIIRFMDFTATNGNVQVNWSDRTLPGRYSQSNYPAGGGDWWQGRGAAFEYCILMCNEENKDMWINLPTKANSNYLLKLAQLVKYGSDGVNPYTSVQANPVYPPLNSNLKVYVEFSNELWNFGFPQWSQLSQTACAEVEAGGSNLNYDNLPLTKDGNGNYVNSGTWALRYWARACKNIGETFRSVFGDADMMTRVRPLFETQSSWADNWLSNGLFYLDKYFNNGDHVSHVATPHPISYYIYGGGGSCYPEGFPDSLYNSDTLTVDQIFNQGYPGMYPAWDDNQKRNIDYLRAFGLKKVGYEGGPGLDSVSGKTVSNQAKIDSQQDSRIKQTYKDMLTHYAQDGGDIWPNFLTCNPTHGLKDYYKDSNMNTYKVQAVSEWRGAGLPAVTWGTAMPASIYGYRYNVCSDCYSSGNQDNPVGFNSSNQNWYGYTVRSTTSRSYTLKVNAGAADANGRLDVIVDGSLVGTITIPNTGSKTTYADSGTLNITLSAGQHGIRLDYAAGDFNVYKLITT